MWKKGSVAALAIAAFALTSPVRAAVIGFDDIPPHTATGDSPITNPYAGFNWNDVYVSGTGIDGGGYTNGVVSPSHDAYNGFNDVASFSPVSGTFTFNSVYITGAFGNENVTLTGWLAGVQIDTATVAVLEIRTDTL